jgi:hypothetical protein
MLWYYDAQYNVRTLVHSEVLELDRYMRLEM